jgi:hypothetical protein
MPVLVGRREECVDSVGLGVAPNSGRGGCWWEDKGETSVVEMNVLTFIC